MSKSEQGQEKRDSERGQVEAKQSNEVGEETEKETGRGEGGR